MLSWVCINTGHDGGYCILLKWLETENYRILLKWLEMDIAIATWSWF